MRGCWVTFCDHVIYNRWDPALVGKRCKPPHRRARFGSVPFIRCVSSPKGLKCFRLDRLGRRRRVSFSPPKKVSMNAYSTGSARDSVPRMTVPDKCQAHILDHMRCNCSACMNFACKWRNAAKDAFQKRVRDPFAPSYKPRRWMYLTGKDASPQRASILSKGEAELNSRFSHRSRVADRHRCRHRSPKVSWWFGNYQPSSESQDGSSTSDSPRLNQRECHKFFSKFPAKARQDENDLENKDGYHTVAMDGTQKASALRNRSLPCDDPVCVDCVKRCAFPDEETLHLRQPLQRSKRSSQRMPNTSDRGYLNVRFDDRSSNKNFWSNYVSKDDREKYEAAKEKYHREMCHWKECPHLTKHNEIADKTSLGKIDYKDAAYTDHTAYKNAGGASGTIYGSDGFENLHISRNRDKRDDLDNSFNSKSDCSENNISMDNASRHRRDDTFSHERLNCGKSFTESSDYIKSDKYRTCDTECLHGELLNGDSRSKIYDTANELRDSGKSCREISSKGKKAKLPHEKKSKKEDFLGSSRPFGVNEDAKTTKSPVLFLSYDNGLRFHTGTSLETPKLDDRKDNDARKQSRHKHGNDEINKKLLHEHFKEGNRGHCHHKLRSPKTEVVVDNVANNKALVRSSHNIGKHFDSSTCLPRKCKHGCLQSPQNKMRLLGGGDNIDKDIMSNGSTPPRKSVKKTALVPYSSSHPKHHVNCPHSRHCHYHKTHASSNSEDISRFHNEITSELPCKRFPEKMDDTSKQSRHVSFSPIRERHRFHSNRSSCRCSPSPQSLNNSRNHSHSTPSNSKSREQPDCYGLRNHHNPRQTMSDSNINHSIKEQNEKAHVPFLASERVLNEKIPQTQSKWLDKHISLMEECSKERQDNAKKRMTRIVDKTNGLKKSMDYIRLDFGDLEERLDKVRETQRLYLKRAKQAVESAKNRNNGNILGKQNRSFTPLYSHRHHRMKTSNTENQMDSFNDLNIKGVTVQSPAADADFIEAVRKANCILERDNDKKNDKHSYNNDSNNKWDSFIENPSPRLEETRNTSRHDSRIHDELNSSNTGARIDDRLHRKTQENDGYSHNSSANNSHMYRSRKDNLCSKKTFDTPDNGNKERDHMRSSDFHIYGKKADENMVKKFSNVSTTRKHGSQKSPRLSSPEQHLNKKKELTTWAIVRKKMRQGFPEWEKNKLEQPDNFQENYNFDCQANAFQRNEGRCKRSSHEQPMAIDSSHESSKETYSADDESFDSAGNYCTSDPMLHTRPTFTSNFLKSLESKTRRRSNHLTGNSSRENITDETSLDPFPVQSSAETMTLRESPISIDFYDDMINQAKTKKESTKYSECERTDPTITPSTYLFLNSHEDNQEGNWEIRFTARRDLVSGQSETYRCVDTDRKDKEKLRKSLYFANKDDVSLSDAEIEQASSDRQALRQNYSERRSSKSLRRRSSGYISEVTESVTLLTDLLKT